MLVGIVVLSALALMFFLGKLKGVSAYFGNDFVAMVLILFVIVGNLIPPYLFKNSAVYFGGVLLALISFLLIFVNITGGEKVLTIVGTLILAVCAFTFTQFILLPLELAPIFSYIILTILVGIVGYVFGKTPISIFIITYLGLFLSQIAQFVISIKTVTGGVVTNYLGGGAPFSISICAATVAVGISLFVSRLARRTQAKRYIFEGEASEELTVKDDEKTKEKKNVKK